MNFPSNLLVAALISVGLIPRVLFSQSEQDPKPPMVLEERDGLVAVEAEYFFKQTLTEKRSWHIVKPGQTAGAQPDGDPNHTSDAGGNIYLECLPDTRRTHDDKLIGGENFSNVAGAMAVLHYKVFFNNPGRYYVWVRAYSTGSEDNGIHVGIDGQWPASGQRMQWCQGKNTWRWESKQRTQEQHCGEPYKIFLDIPTAGEHEIMFSMREDGFEFDRFLLTREREFERPEGQGPTCIIRGTIGSPDGVLAGVEQLQSPSPRVKNKNAPGFPAHWGEQPRIQTRDYRPLPGGYGFGSGTLARWIRFNMDRDEAVGAGLVIDASRLDRDGSGYYLDQGKWLAINPDQRRQAQIKTASPFPSGKYHITLHVVGENDGQSAYSIRVNGTQVGEFTAPLSNETYAEGQIFSRSFRDIEVNSGDVIDISSKVGSRDGEEFSRARWSRLTFNPADEATRRAVANFKPVADEATVGSGDSPAEASVPQVVEPRQPDGDGSVEISGDLMQWHKVTLTLDGPYSHERDQYPNPFTDHHFSVEFRHESGSPVYAVPGYFAADGDAADTSAESGTKWRAHLAADKAGEWHYTISFTTGKLAALDLAEETTIQPYSGITGSFTVNRTNKAGRDFRAHGRLEYTGKHHLKFAGSGIYFLKAGPDAPENHAGIP